MGAPLRVLMVEAPEDDAISIARVLQRSGYDPMFEQVDTPDAFSAALARQPWDIIIADYSTPHFGELDALTLWKESGLDLPFILVSDNISEDVVMTAIKAGAHDCVMKDNLARLGIAVQRELREAEVRLAGKQAEEVLKGKVKKTCKLEVFIENSRLYLSQRGIWILKKETKNQYRAYDYNSCQPLNRTEAIKHIINKTFKLFFSECKRHFLSGE